MTNTILVINAGSSSIKFRLFTRNAELTLLAHGKVDDIGNTPVFEAMQDEISTSTVQKLPSVSSHEDGLRAICEWIHGHENGWHITAVAHRVVHGGKIFTAPVRVTPIVLGQLKGFCPLAPLHQLHNLRAIGIVDKLLPQVPQIACFDTAFHARHGPLFSLYALPQDLTDKGVCRYGFHGLSYEWIVHVLRQNYSHLAEGRVIAGHLGNGASLCAILDGKSVDTTMGMTTLDGLPMGTRSGALDPGAVIYMIRDLGLLPDEVEHTLYEKAGLKGLSGRTNDVKELLVSHDPKAKFALDYFTLKVAQYMAMMAVSIGGVDAIVFTGGIGENAATIRAAVMGRLAFLGTPEVLVVPADEERMMAMHALDSLGDGKR